jgi:glyoxylase-like metal-dependent hydrolase (beta-lactamase superfamily II)
MNPEVYRFNVGKVECIAIKDGGGPRVARQFLPDAPPEELERIIRQQGLDPEAIEFSINILTVKTGEHTVLFDTGMGPSVSNLPEKLKSEGIDPEAVDLIIITHGHWDHIGGILDGEGAFLYPNAHYALSKTEWDYWTAADRFAESDENPARAVWEILSAHRERIILLDTGTGEAEILSGMCAVAAPGHTPGHIAVIVESEGEGLLHIADAAHHYFQLACAQWSPSFDNDKIQSVETRRSLFQRAAQDKSALFAYHFVFPGMGKVVEQAGTLVWQER